MMRSMARIALLMLGWTAAAAAAPAASSDRDRAAIEALENGIVALPGPRPGPRLAPLADRMRDMNVPAVSVAFIEDGRVKWARAYGVAIAGSRRPVTPATRFQAGSLSKAVAAAGALRLVDRGRLALDENVNLRLRAWRVPGRADWAAKVTLRRLLGHGAGLTVSAYPGYRPGRRLPTLVQSLRGADPAVTAPVRLFAEPGTRTAYSGGGYSVAQLLMSEAAGADFPALMRSLVLRPAGMTRSSFAPPPPGLRGAAGGHDSNGAPIPGGGNRYPEMAAAGLWTTPSDYGRFLIAVQQSRAGRPGALLSPGSARAMTTPALTDYGMGLILVERGGRTAVTHGGANEGFECRFVAFLDGSRQGLVVMTNGDNGGFLAAAIQRTIGQAYGWDDLLGPPTPRAPES
jgi:CubicO group peptidase (beta-lactamase class C family)